jgi:hypothetical protein
MNRLKNSLIVFAGFLAVIGVVTFCIPSLTKGQKSADVPKSAFSVVADQTQPVSGPDPGGTSYAITSLTVSNRGSASVTAFAFARWSSTTDCSGGFSSGPIVAVPAGETVHMSFPQAFVLSAQPSATSCLMVGHSGGAVDFTVVGYKF